MPAKLLLVPAVLTVAVAVHLYRDERFRDNLRGHLHTLRTHAASAVHRLADRLAPPPEQIPLAAVPPADSPPAARRRNVHDVPAAAVTSAYDPATEHALFAADDSDTETEMGARTPQTATTAEAAEAPPEMEPEVFWSIHEWAEAATGSAGSEGSAPSEGSLSGWSEVASEVSERRI